MSDTNTRTSAGKGPSAVAISPDLVRKVADRVYALWLEEMTVERERGDRRAQRASSPHRGEK